ncbi:hypothetical protein F2P56_010778 [Juglans regia]|uniref:Uncharacterized protein n=2 Tax=Juglans regia TaxID=51240 RepID=A0A833XS48_JUGRE|nr:adenylylsulfatase HINT3-like [Juglans regia]KAF5470254.1 hypothetical protein F2P56_010778 [Juglans regia]
MEARRLAILSSHICPLGSSQPRGRTRIPLFSTLSFSDCASDSDETKRLRDSQKKVQQNDCVFCKIVCGKSPALKLYEDHASKVQFISLLLGVFHFTLGFTVV